MPIWTCCFILWCLPEAFRTCRELRSTLFVGVFASGPAQGQHLVTGDSCDLRTSILHVSFCLHHFLSGRWALVLLGLHPLVLLSLGGSGFCKMATLQSEEKWWCVTKYLLGPLCAPETWGCSLAFLTIPPGTYWAGSLLLMTVLTEAVTRDLIWIRELNRSSSWIQDFLDWPQVGPR